jgi:hypothetical protein
MVRDIANNEGKEQHSDHGMRPVTFGPQLAGSLNGS